MSRDRERALQALKRFTKERNFLTGEEAISPAEIWLLKKIESITHKDAICSRGYRRQFMMLGKRLNLWPIPDWWRAARRIKCEKSEPAHKSAGYLRRQNSPSDMWSVTPKSAGTRW